MRHAHNKKRLPNIAQFFMMNSLMALILSIIISAGMTWMQRGLGEGYWSDVWTAVWQSFLIALPAAHIVAFFIQKFLDRHFIFTDKNGQ